MIEKAEQDTLPARTWSFVGSMMLHGDDKWGTDSLLVYLSLYVYYVKNFAYSHHLLYIYCIIATYADKMNIAVTKAGSLLVPDLIHEGGSLTEIGRYSYGAYVLSYCLSTMFINGGDVTEKQSRDFYEWVESFCSISVQSVVKKVHNYGMPPYLLPDEDDSCSASMGNALTRDSTQLNFIPLNDNEIKIVCVGSWVTYLYYGDVDGKLQHCEYLATVIKVNSDQGTFDIKVDKETKIIRNVKPSELRFTYNQMTCKVLEPLCKALKIRSKGLTKLVMVCYVIKSS